jgi:hypothetical protein
VLEECAIRPTFVLHGPHSRNGFVIDRQVTPMDGCPVLTGFTITHIELCDRQKIEHIGFLDRLRECECIGVGCRHKE